jgi:ABC-2 type transport system ATP-binding protein
MKNLLGEVEITCDRVAFIKKGQVVLMSSLKELKDGNLAVELKTGGISAEALAGLGRWSRDARVEGECLYLSLGSEALLPEIHRYLVSQSVDIYSCKPHQVSLEDLFTDTIGDDGGL